jgi:hypothetical protein
MSLHSFLSAAGALPHLPDSIIWLLSKISQLAPASGQF